MSKGLLVFGLAFLLLVPSLALAGTFEDVKDSHWAYKSVESLAEKGIVKGIPRNNKLYFDGSKNMTRYEFAVAMDNAIKYLTERSGGPFILETETIEVPQKLPTLTEVPEQSSNIFSLDETRLLQLEKTIKNLTSQIDIHERDILELGKRVQNLEEASAKGTTISGKRDTTFWMSAGALICSIAALLIAVGK